MEALTKAQRELYEWLVDYIRTNQHSPSIRQMMKAMHLKSPAPVQSRLERLKNKQYIDWTEGKARTIRVLYHEAQGIPVLGAIAAGGMVEPYTENQERLDLIDLFNQPDCFGLRVMGDSMIEDFIAEGDVAIMRPLPASEQPKEGAIVAARVAGEGTTLKRFYRKEDVVMLKPSNPNYTPMEYSLGKVEVQGILVGVWRDY